MICFWIDHCFELLNLLPLHYHRSNFLQMEPIKYSFSKVLIGVLGSTIYVSKNVGLKNVFYRKIKFF